MSSVQLAGGNIDTISTIKEISKVKAVGDVDKGIEPIKFCHWASPQWGDSGNLAEAALYSAALIAVAVVNTIAQWNIAQKRYQIAKDYANLATDKWNRFREGYAPLERAMLNEASSVPIPVPNYAKARSDYSGWARAAYSEALRRLDDVAGKYELCVDPSLSQDLSNAGITAQVDGINWGYRFEENRAIIKDDERWNRRSSLLNLGRDIHAESAKYASYANDILKGLGSLVAEGTEGAMSLLGYLNNRRDTQYPEQFSGSVGLNDPAGMQGNFSNLYSGAQIGASWS